MATTKKSTQLFFASLLFFFASIQTSQAEESYTGESQEIYEIIDRWAEAWINLDAETYISYYSKRYRPDEKISHRAWSADRRHRFAVQKWIKLGITGIVISKRDDNSYYVKFKQRYKSDSFRDTVRKELIFIKEDSQWKINSERVVGH